MLCLFLISCKQVAFDYSLSQWKYRTGCLIMLHEQNYAISRLWMKRRHSLNLLLMILKQHCVVVEFHNLHYCYSCGMYFTDGYKMSRGFLRSSTKQRFAALLVANHLGKVLRYSPGNLRFFSVCGKKPYFVFSSFRVLLYLTETKIQWPEHCGLFCGRP